MFSSPTPPIRGARTAWTAIALAVLVAGCQGTGRPPDDADPAAPAFEAENLAGRPVNLTEFRGTVVIFNVWATWCVSCRYELRVLNNLTDDLRPRGLETVAVSIDGAAAHASVKAFADDLGLNFTVLHDPDGDQVRPTFRTLGTPDTFILDARGRIVDRWTGAWDPMSNATRHRIEAALP